MRRPVMPQFVTLSRTFNGVRHVVRMVALGLAAGVAVLPLPAQSVNAQPVSMHTVDAPEAVMPFALHERVRLRIAGNSRFSVDVDGRDEVRAQLLALLPRTREQGDCEGPVALRAGERIWLTSLAPARPQERFPALLLVRTDSTGAATSITVHFDDEERVAKRYPRDDGIVRTSLTEKRNRDAVLRLHGSGGVRRVLIASGERVYVTVPNASNGQPGWHLVEYTFDATGAVRSMSTSATLSSTLISTIR